MSTALRPVPNPAPSRAVAYCRVSTTGQATEGVSLEAQQAKLEAMAALDEHDLVETITDEGRSACSLRRPGVQRLIMMIEAGEVDAVLVTRLDRLTRSVRDLSDLIELCNRQGVALVSHAESLDTGTAAGRMVCSMLGVVAQWQREDISEKTIETLAHVRSQGKRTGTVPYGFTADSDGALHEDAQEQAALADLRSLRSLGLSFATVARRLTDYGHARRNGKPWTRGAVRRLENPEQTRIERRRKPTRSLRTGA